MQTASQVPVTHRSLVDTSSLQLGGPMSPLASRRTLHRGLINR